MIGLIEIVTDWHHQGRNNRAYRSCNTDSGAKHHGAYRLRHPRTQHSITLPESKQGPPLIHETPQGRASLKLGAPSHHLVDDHGEMISMDWILRELGLWNASTVHNFGRGLDGVISWERAGGFSMGRETLASEIYCISIDEVRRERSIRKLYLPFFFFFREHGSDIRVTPPIAELAHAVGRLCASPWTVGTSPDISQLPKGVLCSNVMVRRLRGAPSH